MNDVARKIASAEKRQRTREIRIQALKYFDEHEDAIGKNFVQEAQIQDSYFAEADKMKAMLQQLKKAGLKPNEL